MKILLAAHACEPGAGSEPGVGWNWARQLARRHEVWVVACGRNRENVERKLPNEDYIRRIHFRYTNCHSTMEHVRSRFDRHFLLSYLHIYGWMFNCYKTARELAREVDFDVAINVTFCSWRLPPLLHRLEIPFIWGPMGGGESIPEGLLGVLDRRGRAQEGVREVCQRLSRFDPLLREAFRESTMVLAANRDTQRLIGAHFGREAELFSHCGIEDDLIRPVREPHQGVNLICVSWFRPRKAVILALEAFARARAACREKLHLTLVGDGQERRRLERRAAELALDDRAVSFVGGLPRPQLIALYPRMDICLFPSLRDSAPVSILEAMSAGLPVVCLDLGGPGEMVCEECGIKVAPDSREEVIEGLAAAIVRLAGDPELRDRLGRGARQRVERCYGWERKGELFESLLREVVARGEVRVERGAIIRG